jgi:hypothetical protein
MLMDLLTDTKQDGLFVDSINVLASALDTLLVLLQIPPWYALFFTLQLRTLGQLISWMSVMPSSTASSLSVSTVNKRLVSLIPLSLTMPVFLYKSLYGLWHAPRAWYTSIGMFVSDCIRVYPS